MVTTPSTRKLTIVAKDPGLRLGGDDGPMAFAQVSVPAELLAKGPTGYRIKVVDYNSTDRCVYRDEQAYQQETGELIDPFAPRLGQSIHDQDYQRACIANPNFHAQNVYAIAMRTLGAFERALGRRVGWSSGGHQLHIAPHAFAQANAFYSEPDRALLFGYFFGEDGTPIFTSLSHDIVAHETSHALLDGLRPHFSEPSGPDQAAFHEGLSDIVALLSIFTIEPVVAAALGEDGALMRDQERIALVSGDKLTPAKIKSSILLGMAQQVGASLYLGRGDALRQSVKLTARAAKKLRESPDEHERGEVLVAAMMNAFVKLWSKRIDTLGTFGDDLYNLASVVGEGAKIAEQLLNMAIRAIDYCPPTDIDFGQYLAALLTADREILPEDAPYRYRAVIRASFKAYGIVTPRKMCDVEGCWRPFASDKKLNYARSNYAEMTRSPDEFFRFLWENKTALDLTERAYTEVLSIDSASRVGPDGILLRETICQYVQRFDMFGAEFVSLLDTERPEGMASNERYVAFGGGAVVLDQYGQVKYHVANRISDGARQKARAEYLHENGRSGPGSVDRRLQFAARHLDRMGA